MENNIKISIIIPIYNMEKYLRKALNSCINQTLKEIEIICIDDCSTDKSSEILKEYTQKDSRIKIITQKINQGQGVARNIGIKQAIGEYIMFLDPDDWYELCACETAYKQITKNNNDIVLFNFFYYNNETKKFSISENYTNALNNYKHYNNLSTLKDNVPYSNYCVIKIYSRQFLIKNKFKFTPTRCAEDNPFAIKTTLAATSISVLNEFLYNYRIINFKKDKLRKQTINKRVQNWHEAFDNRELTYQILLTNKICTKDFHNSVLEWYINKNTSELNHYIKLLNTKQKNKLYIKIHKMFSKVYETENIKEIENNIDINKFNIIVKSKTLLAFKINTVLSRFIFSVYSYKNKKRLNFFGFKISLH